jgi:hypothetical protein
MQITTVLHAGVQMPIVGGPAAERALALGSDAAPTGTSASAATIVARNVFMRHTPPFERAFQRTLSDKPF